MDMLKSFVYVVFILTMFGSFIFWAGVCGYDTIMESGLTSEKISLMMWSIPFFSVITYNKVVGFFNKTVEVEVVTSDGEKPKKQRKKTSCKKCGRK